jgi:hypothetical protein
MSRRFLILIAILAVPLSLIIGPVAQKAVAQAAATATITPTSGPAGSTVAASGANWTPGDHIQAQWGDNNANLGSPVVVAGDGTFKDSFKIPSGVSLGTHQVLFWDQEGRFFEIANFNVTNGSTPPSSSCSAPSVSLKPSSGPVGSQFLMEGAGWAPGGSVHITLPYGSQGIFYAKQATPTVGAGGAWQTTVTVGKSPVGSYAFTFAETGCPSKDATFNVSAPLPPRPMCQPAHPIIYWSQVAGPAGVRFSLTSSGWHANGTVTITLPAGGVFHVSRTSWHADSAGDWHLNISVEHRAHPGKYRIIFSQSACGGLQVTGIFEVTMTAVQ